MLIITIRLPLACSLILLFRVRNFTKYLGKQTKLNKIKVLIHMVIDYWACKISSSVSKYGLSKGKWGFPGGAVIKNLFACQCSKRSLISG